jgi:hypothetical protein
MENPERATQGAGTTQRAAARQSLANQPCPNAILCRRWSAADGGPYCRLCWRDVTYPRPVRIAEGLS